MTAPPATAVLSIRDAGEDDVPAITRLINLAYQVEAFFVSGERIGGSEVAAMLARGTFLLAERDGGSGTREPAARVLVGSAYVEDRGDHGYIGLVSVDPVMQRGGVGRALMSAAEAMLRARGCPRAEILVVDLREELPPWYRRLGYREVGVRPFPQDAQVLRPCHFVVMSKRLWIRGERSSSCTARAVV